MGIDINRRRFVVLSTLSAAWPLGMAAGQELGPTSTQWYEQVQSILTRFLELGPEHESLMRYVASCLWTGHETTDDGASNRLRLRDASDSASTEQYVIQEFFNLTNYRAWRLGKASELTLSPLAMELSQNRVPFVGSRLALLGCPSRPIFEKTGRLSD